MSTDIIKYVSRYVVPFYFEYENNGYENLKKHFLSDTIDKQKLGLPRKGQWVEAGFWEKYNSGDDTQPEIDLYSYLLSVFLEDKNTKEKDESNLGISLVFKHNGDGKILKIDYNHEGTNIAFTFKDLGVLLFRNGIGFIWYEIAFDKEVSIDEYVCFQNIFKELARKENSFIRKFKKVKKGSEHKDKKSKEDIEEVNEPFGLGKWLSEVLAADELGIRFWAERNKTGDGNTIRIPDKALLFQYMFTEQTTNFESEKLVFHIANGYDEKYNAPDNIAENLYKPFGNTCFYVSKSGMACVAINYNTNNDFFTNEFQGKIIRDYFFIYLLLIYQSYSCAHYSRLLTKLPADEELFNKQVMYADRLESLNGQINLFLVKSVFESVSNIHHQNGFYRYGKKELCIEEDIRSLTIGLGALEEMVNDKRKQNELKEREIEREKREEHYRLEQAKLDEEKEKEEKRDRNLDHAVIVFGIMMFFSALIDGLSVVDWWKDNNGPTIPGHWVIIIVIGVFTLYLVIAILRNKKK